MLIGELSKRTGLTKDTIRFYEEQGLITVGFRDRRQNNYKEYSEGVLQRLLSIKFIKSLGFTLNETANLLDRIESNEATCDYVEEKVKNKVQTIDEKVADLLRLRNTLLDDISKCESKECNNNGENQNCPILSSSCS